MGTFGVIFVRLTILILRCEMGLVCCVSGPQHALSVQGQRVKKLQARKLREEKEEVIYCSIELMQCACT